MFNVKFANKNIIFINVLKLHYKKKNNLKLKILFFSKKCKILVLKKINKLDSKLPEKNKKKHILLS